MAICNPDGTPYQVSGSLQQFDPDSPEHDLFNLIDQEAIEIGGSPIFYYEVFIDSNSIDHLFREARSKLWTTTPIKLYAYYDPITSQNFHMFAGVDAPDEIVFNLNYRDVLNRIGHPPKVGSRIYTPHKRENWVIKQRNVDEFKLWGEIRLKLACDRFQESLTTGEGKMLNQQEPDFKVN